MTASCPGPEAVRRRDAPGPPCLTAWARRSRWRAVPFLSSSIVHFCGKKKFNLCLNLWMFFGEQWFPAFCPFMNTIVISCYSEIWTGPPSVKCFSGDSGSFSSYTFCDVLLLWSLREPHLDGEQQQCKIPSVFWQSGLSRWIQSFFQLHISTILRLRSFEISLTEQCFTWTERSVKERFTYPDCGCLNLLFGIDLTECNCCFSSVYNCDLDRDLTTSISYLCSKETAQ